MKSAPVIVLGLAAVAMVVAIQLAPRRSAQAIGQYATPLDQRTRNQAHNARLSASKLDGKIIPAHATFSFNETIGSWSRDAGYRRAPVSYDGQLIDDWGGGVCQTSTTLYNAALLAGLEILERHPHHFAPSYAPPGRDAAVAYGAFDLRFKNPYAAPIKIQAKLVHDRLHVALLSTEGSSEAVRIESQIAKGSPPMTIRLKPEGRQRVRNEGKVGVTASVTRVIGTRREHLSTDHYPTMHRVVEGSMAE
ncbi:MAG: VanW family protein [Fimbriimonadaceae bacterium]